MKRISTIGLIIAAFFLTACGAQEGEIARNFGGSEKGGFDSQVTCSSVLDAAFCVGATRTANGRIDLQAKVLKDSTAGKVTTALATAIPIKGMDYAIARDLQGRAKCDGNNCGGDTFVLQGGQGGTAQAVSDVDNRLDAKIQNGTCGANGTACLSTD